MGRLPQSNAKLLSISSPGFSPDGDLPAGDATPKWTGSSDAYVVESLVTSTAAGRLDLFDVDSIVVPGDLRPSVSIDRGDQVSFDYAGTTRTRTVLNVRARLLVGTLPTVRIELENA